LAAVTSSGVVTQEGHWRLLVSSLKVRAMLSTGTFMVEPPLGPEDRSSGESTTRPVRQAFASGEPAQATASCRASVSKAPTFTVPGGGLAVDRAVGDDAGTPMLPTYVVAGPAASELPALPALPALAAHPATATRPMQAASRENDRRSTRTITASREGISTAAWTRLAPRRFRCTAGRPVNLAEHRIRREQVRNGLTYECYVAG
jgi:hypothetical protein